MKKYNKQNQMAQKYSIILNVNEDALNWYNGCNKIANGLDWSKEEGVPEEVVKNIQGKSKEDAFNFLIPYLKQKYINEKKKIDDYKKYIDSEFDQKYNIACQKITELTCHPLYRNDSTVYLTTFPRCPFNYDTGVMLIFTECSDPIAILLHELLHCQFIKYWANNKNSKISKLDNIQFEWIKESLTVILDEDLFPIIKKVDTGYKLHDDFRNELHIFWKTNKRFDDLITFGLKILPKFINKKI